MANDSYGEKLVKRISDIDIAHAAFKGETEKLLHWRAKFISHNGIVTRMATQQIDMNLRSVDVKIHELQKEQRKVGQEISAVGSKIANNVSTVLQDLQKNAQWLQDREECSHKLLSQALRIKELEKQLQDKTIRASTLAQRLELSSLSDNAVADANLALSEGLNQCARYQARAKHIAEAEEFRDWFVYKGSKILCVDGNSDQDSLSPTAFLASLVVQNMSSQADKILALPFFCGLHTNAVELDKHTISGPILLLRNLVAQILDLENIDAGKHLQFLSEDHVRAMECMDVRSYLKALKSLLISLVRNYRGVLIIIESIDFYDKERYQAELKQIMKFLANVTNEIPSREGRLKVLIMASSQSKMFRRFSGVDILDVPEEIECDGEAYESF